MPREDAGETLLEIRLTFVIALLENRPASFADDAIHVATWDEKPDEARPDGSRTKIVGNGGLDVRILHLDRDVDAVRQRRAMDLADRCRRGGGRDPSFLGRQVRWLRARFSGFR